MLIKYLDLMRKHTVDEKTLVELIILNQVLLQIFIDNSTYEELLEFTKEQNLLHEFFYENLYYMPNVTKGKDQNKCKKEVSRTQGYKLIYKLIKVFKPKDMFEFVDKYMWEMIKDLPAPVKWHHAPSDK